MKYTAKLIKYVRDFAGHARADKSLANSLYLIASTGVMAVFGFAFWFISARMYSPHDIGLSSTLISVATTLSLVSLLGFDNALVHYMPQSKKPNRVIDTGLLLSAITAIVLSIAALLILNVVSPALTGVLRSPWHIAIFVLTLVLITINTLTDSVFIGNREAQFILIADGGLSLGKIALPIALAGFGAFGLFVGFAGSVTIAALISLYFMYKRYGYKFTPRIHKETIKATKSYLAWTYVSGLIAALSPMILPVMMTNQSGPTAAAYFNLAMTIAAMLYIIPRSTANSLFAEASKAPAELPHFLGRALRHTAVLMLPALAILLVAGRLILSVFGSSYAAGGTTVLQIMAIASLTLAFNVIASTVLKVCHQLKLLLVREIIGTVITLTAGYFLISRFGAVGAGLAWLSGQLSMTLFLIPSLLATRGKAPVTIAPTIWEIAV